MILVLTQCNLWRNRFGDTVNTAARLESTGMRNRIQVSHTTAAEIEKLGKGHWLTKREDVVVAKGKGAIESYWLVPASRQASIQNIAQGPTTPEASREMIIAAVKQSSSEEKRTRLVDWCVEILLDKLRQIQALRQGLFLAQTATYDALVYTPEEGRTCMDEVQEVMKLPPYDPKAAAILASMDHRNVQIDPEVVDQLRQFVSILAQAYRANHFHSFEHACVSAIISLDETRTRLLSRLLSHFRPPRFCSTSPWLWTSSSNESFRQIWTGISRRCTSIHTD